MKKTYRKPTAKCIAMDGADAILQSVSGQNGLDGTCWGGNTSDVQTQGFEAETKEFSSKNLWNDEW